MLACGAAFIAVSSCSGPPEPAQARPWLEFDSIDQGSPNRRARHVRNYAVADEFGQWTVESTAHERVETEDGPALLLSGSGVRMLTIPGPFEPGTFNRMVIRARVTGPIFESDGHIAPEYLRVAFRTGEHWTLVPDPAALLLGDDVQRVELDLSKPLDVSAPFDELVIAFTGGAKRNELFSVELLDCPPGYFVPEPRKGTGWVMLGQTARRGIGLFSGSPRTASFDVADGAVLQFFHGIPAGAALADQEVMLKIEIEGDSTEVHEARVLPGATWQPFELDLAHLAGQEVRAKFSVSADTGTAACVLSAPRSDARKPDANTVLVVTSDTHRADYIGAANTGVNISTPVLDALAARGVLFENAIAPANATNPSHVSIFTATHPRDTGVVDNSSPVSTAATTLAEVFRDAGYDTVAAVSANHLGPASSGLGQGFQTYFWPAPGTSETFPTIEHVLASVDASEGRPLFVWLHLFDAHTPYGPPEPYDAMYLQDAEPAGAVLEPYQVPYWAGEGAAWSNSAHYERMYRGEVSYLDASLQQVFEHERLGSGIIAITGDHGESLGRHDVWFDHRMLYPDSLRVPLIMTWPGAPQGVHVKQPVSNIDLARTILDRIGLGSDFPGRDLAALIDSPDADHGPRFAIGAHGLSASIEVDDWFLVLHLLEQSMAPGKTKRVRHQVELYNLREDPGTVVNLVESEVPRVKRMRTALTRFLSEASETGWNVEREQTAAELADLAALGYTGGARTGTENDWFDGECECDWCERY
jgi:arylsulfatase A-like enzyme